MLEISVTQTAQQKAHEGAGKGVVPVDAHFHVNGVGVVVLGSVAQGSIKKYDTVKVLPTAKTAQIRSIQKLMMMMPSLQSPATGLALP